jgi:alkaline phosphatase
MVKNVILFIGDGMPQSAITAARLLAHKQINGKYQSSVSGPVRGGLDVYQNEDLDADVESHAF